MERNSAPSGPVGQVVKHDGQQDLAFVDLGSRASDQLRESWGEERPFQSGGVIESVWLQPLLGGGATVASSLLAGNVFVATANPATLMTIGSGVGSAVMGSTGIVAQAPFVAASTALIPVVAPVMAFMTLSSMLTSAGLNRVERALNELSKNVKRVKDLMEADDYGRLKSAAERLQEIRSQFEHAQTFTDAMTIAVTSARTTIRDLHHKYEPLASREVCSESDFHTAMFRINLFAASSLLSLEADLLRLYLTHQDDPDHAVRLQTELLTNVETCRNRFRTLLDRNPLETSLASLQRGLDEGSWFDVRPWRAPRSKARAWGKPPWVRKRLRKQVRTIEGLLNETSLIAECSRRLELSRESLVFFRTRGGEGALKAYRTHELELVQAVC